MALSDPAQNCWALIPLDTIATQEAGDARNSTPTEFWNPEGSSAYPMPENLRSQIQGGQAHARERVGKKHRDGGKRVAGWGRAPWKHQTAVRERHASGKPILPINRAQRSHWSPSLAADLAHAECHSIYYPLARVTLYVCISSTDRNTGARCTEARYAGAWKGAGRPARWKHSLSVPAGPAACC